MMFRRTSHNTVYKSGHTGQAGMTLLEVMISIAILVIMMTLAWKTIANTSESKKQFEKFEERNHELRMALAGCARLPGRYLSLNEDPTR